MARYARELPAKLQRDFTGAMKLLRDPIFQKLLVELPAPAAQLHQGRRLRRPRVVRCGSCATRLATSTSRRITWTRSRPSFARIRPRCEAIRILLDRPKEWGTEALAELKAKLAAAPERFTVDTLEKAHRLRYDKELVDIISMVKHAARDEEPLLTAEERVGRAFDG